MLYYLAFMIALSFDNPPISDAKLFDHIPRHAIVELMAFNREYRKHLAKVQVIYPQHQLHEVILENERLHKAWAILFDVHCEYLSVSARKEKLAELRELIGPEMYYRGEMPDFVTLRYFQTLR